MLTANIEVRLWPDLTIEEPVEVWDDRGRWYGRLMGRIGGVVLLDARTESDACREVERRVKERDPLFDRSLPSRNAE